MEQEINKRTQAWTDNETGYANHNASELPGHSSSTYSDQIKYVTQQRSAPKNQGLLTRVCNVIRAFWATSWTEKNASPEELIKTNIRELFIYVVFLITALLITFNMTSPTYYYHTKVLQDLFLDSSTSTGSTFRDINSIEDWWSYVDEKDTSPLLTGIYWDTWYNGENITIDEQNYIFYENKVLGVPRIRQLRVREGSCTVSNDFAGDISACYGAYNGETMSVLSYGDPLNSAFVWRDEQQLGGSSHHGWLGYNYDGSGFIQDLNLTKDASANEIAQLKLYRWLDRQTRVVFIDFTVYNANVNLFCVIRLTTEFPPTGGAITSWSFRTVKMLTMDYGWDKVLQGLYIFYMIMVGYYVVEEALEIGINGFTYFGEFWNWVDICIIIASVIACAFKVYQEQIVSEQIAELSSKVDSYPDFAFIAYWTEQCLYMIAITVFLCWIKLFKYISFNRTLRQLQTTLTRCAFDIIGFLIMFIIIFVAYAQLGYLIFGTIVGDFYTPSQSMYTLFRIILGDFNFHALERANYILGPLYFISYVILVFFILLNMFLAIINDTYSEVKADMALQESDFEIADYIKKGYDKVLRKLKLRKDHLGDLQDALGKADTNNDKRLDFDEWKNDLKLRGIPEAEIEGVFAQYDTDGDRCLDEDEQRRLRLSLERQKNELQDKIHDVGGTMNRNASGSNPSEVASSIFGANANTDEILQKLAKHFVGNEEFQLVTKRIDRLEKHVQLVSAKIDGIIVKLDERERVTERKKDNLTRVIDREMSDNSSMTSSSTKTSAGRRAAPRPPK